MTQSRIERLEHKSPFTSSDEVWTYIHRQVKHLENMYGRNTRPTHVEPVQAALARALELAGWEWGMEVPPGQPNT